MYVILMPSTHRYRHTIDLARVENQGVIELQYNIKQKYKFLDQ